MNGNQIAIDSRVRLSGPPDHKGSSRKGIERRKQILDRALEVFGDVGFEGTSMRAIAEKMGVTHPTLSRYFASREELFLAVLREHDRRGAEAIQVVGESLAQTFARASDYAMRVPGLMGMLHVMVSRALEIDNDLSQSYFIERYKRVRAQTRVVLEAGRAAGTVRNDIPLDQAAALVVAAIDGLSVQWLLDGSTNLHTGLILVELLLEPPTSSTAPPTTSR